MSKEDRQIRTNYSIQATINNKILQYDSKNKQYVLSGRPEISGEYILELSGNLFDADLSGNILTISNLNDENLNQ